MTEVILKRVLRSCPNYVMGAKEATAEVLVASYTKLEVWAK